MATETERINPQAKEVDKYLPDKNYSRKHGKMPATGKSKLNNPFKAVAKISMIREQEQIRDNF